jgi:hypothetical protein
MLGGVPFDGSGRGKWVFARSSARFNGIGRSCSEIDPDAVEGRQRKKRRTERRIAGDLDNFAGGGEKCVAEKAGHAKLGKIAVLVISKQCCAMTCVTVSLSS